MRAPSRCHRASSHRQYRVSRILNLESRVLMTGWGIASCGALIDTRSGMAYNSVTESDGSQ